MRYVFIHAIALLAVLLFSGTASADGSQVVYNTTTGQSYTVIPNGQTGSIVVNNRTHEVTVVINQRQHQPAAPKGALERARIRDQHRR